MTNDGWISAEVWFDKYINQDYSLAFKDLADLMQRRPGDYSGWGELVHA